MKYISAVLIAFILLVGNYTNAQKMDSQSKALLDNLIKVNGGYKALINAKDVHFKYLGLVDGKVKRDSDEKHIFQGEHSLSISHGVFNSEKGLIKKALVNGNASLSVNDKTYTDKKAKKSATFDCRVTFYWFTMAYKLLDESTIFTYLGKETLNGVKLDKVKMVFDTSKTEKKANDEYLLYFNPKTHLLDAFVYSKTGGDVIKDPKARIFVTYEKIDGIYVPIKRVNYKKNEKGEWYKRGIFTFSDVTFNNGYKPEDFSL